ncbi:MAG: MinD/ParA family ATP-binding protein [Spongiibacteraceae bacterium]
MTSKPVQVLAITGGKGGVGKTTTAINIGIALAQAGSRVAILDADFSLANVDVLLGVKAEKNIEQVLDGECSLRDVMVAGPAGLMVIPSASGVRRLTRLSELEQAGLIRGFSEIANQLDVLIVDTAAGISDSVISFVSAAQEVVLVVCNEASSITDAYAMIKVLNRDYGIRRFRVLANMVRDEADGEQLVKNLSAVCDQFLQVNLRYQGAIPFDQQLRDAVRSQQAVVLSAPASKSARAFRKVAKSIAAWPLPTAPTGYVEFFLERLLVAAREPVTRRSEVSR